MVPCPAAHRELLRVVSLRGCQRHYVPPTPQLLSSVPGSSLFMRVLENTRRRGPETFGATQHALDEVCVMTKGRSGTEEEDLMLRTELQGISAVVGLRGHATVRQPFEMELETDLEEDDERADKPVRKSFLQWNGEIFNGAMCPPPWGSDTVVLASRLSQLEQECVPTSEADPMNHLSLRHRQELFLARCVQVFEEEVQGPYGFLFCASQLKLAVFGRDPLGRHSLLVHMAVYDSLTAENVEASRTDSEAAAAPTGGREVELIISSVGIQHATRLSGHNAVSSTAAAASGEFKRPRPQSGAAKPLPEEPGETATTTCVVEAPDGVGDTTKEGEDTEAAARPPDAGIPLSFKEQRRARKLKKSSAEAADPTERDEEEEAAATTEEEEESFHGCWTELPVSGLFAVPLDRPLLSEDALLSTAAHSLEGTGVSGAVASGLLLHCPWKDRYHRVHPLLRTFVAIADKESVDGREPQSDAGRALSPLPFGLPSVWSPPQRPLLFSTDDTVPALPPLLAERLSRFTPPPGASDDAVWAHWAATCYLHALSAAIIRRTDVAAAGAEDSRDWATFSKALRRPLCVLFSGGIDCTVLAALAHHLLPLETPIELVNVSFGAKPEQAPDRLTALRAVEELLRLPQPEPHEDSLAAAANQGTPVAREREWRLVFVDVPTKLSADTSHILDLVTPRHTVMDLDIGTALWYAAKGAGRMQLLRHSDVVFEEPNKKGPAPSLASTEGARGVEPGDLLGGFHKHVRTGHANAVNPADLARPEQRRPTAAHRDTVTSGNRDETRFQLLLDVLVTEGRRNGGPTQPVLLSTLGKEYGPLLQPHIAAHGYKKVGAFLNDACEAGLIEFDKTAVSKAVRLRRPEDKARAVPPPPCQWYPTPFMKQQQQQQGGNAAGVMTPPAGSYDWHYVSNAKVLLVGMGADETLGGYTRYRRFFTRHGMQGTRRELEKDFAQLWTRNLGRDDRVTMDSGREPRFPYLDEELLMTLEKIVAERRKALLSSDPLRSDTSFAQVLQRKATAANAGPDVGGATSEPSVPTDDDVEAALLQTALEPVMSFRLGPGEGDKRVLRNVAAMIGLETVAKLQKRAIQFGSRIADRRVNGTTKLL